ncbi:double-stranded RNA-specific adenosine deaminase-like isoform X2 [Liolophura sinensis]|uniref:double-stranded RNA-specific adenosine deaminase-like isoform X2 n=1 Tax=Liolophura sinensis TaxID=3198878 RepID=UPI00315991B8
MATRPNRTLKDPVCLLMEYAAKTKIKVDFTDPVREGPDHAPRFVVGSVVDGQKFALGSGSNKKTAKKEAAKIALRALLGDTPTSGNLDNGISENGYDSDEGGSKDPVSELMEYAHVVKATVLFTPVVRDGPDHRPVFCTSAVVSGKCYSPGCAGTKKQAKKEAAQLALEAIELEHGHRSPVSESSHEDSDSIKSNCSFDGKHPTSALMEFAQARNFQVTFLPPEVEGPDHIRRYTTAVVLNGHVLPKGMGVSIKEAKRDAAYRAMGLLTNRAFLAKLLRSSPSSERNGHMSGEQGLESLSPMLLSVLEDFSDKDPICALQEYCVPRRFTVNYLEHPATGPSHQPTFAMACSVDGRVFPTQVSNQKQTAKKEAARIALATILSEAQQRLVEANTIAVGDLKKTLNESASWEDYVAALSHRILEIIQDAQRDKFVKEKVLATIILKRGRKHPGTVVSLGTGNRCILGKHLTSDGKKVHHSHAEVIARRGFLRYLYSQLRGGHTDMFEKSQSGKLKLKPEVSVHLYISRPPCGDASAFIDISNNPVKMRAMKRQGLLRTIMEDGEGAIPCTSEPDEASFCQLQTGDKRLRVMTCSDKICRWNVLGIQGALLSRLLDPIYLTSITVGSFRGQQLRHLPRAVSKRLGTEDTEPLGKYLPNLFRINHPIVGSVTDSSSDVYDLPNSRQYSINWCEGDTTVEVVDGMSGERVVGQGPESMSRVCKLALYCHYMEISRRSRRPGTVQGDNYLGSKLRATEYQAAKDTFIRRLFDLGYGPWIHLPDEIDSFAL